MAHPLHLKVMGITYWEYRAIPDDQKEKWQKEAQKRLEDIAKDPIAYQHLTKSVEQGDKD